MAGDDGGACLLQLRHFERAGDLNRGAHVVMRTVRLSLIQKPELLLRKRKRRSSVSLDRLTRSDRESRGHRRADRLSHRGDSRILEQQTWRHFDLERLAYARTNQRSQQRVSAQLEKIVVGADGFDSQDFTPDL